MKACKPASVFFSLLMAVSLVFQAPAFAQEASDTVTPAPEAEAVQDSGSITTNSIPGWPQGPEIGSAAAVVMETSTNTVLYAKNMDQELFPSSAVKIMTTLLAIENGRLTDEIIMTSTGVSGVTDGGANISAQVGEVFTVEQCMYAIMLVSANDIALQVAEQYSGSIENYVSAMNSRAQQLGCTNTLFTNPTGLPDPEQHTTAHDLTLIIKAAMENETFRKIAGTLTYTIPATNLSGGERVLKNQFLMTDPASADYYQPCTGGKEGYTDASGSVLSCVAEKNGLTLACTIMKGAADHTAAEAAQLLDYAFDNFEMKDFADKDFSVVSGGTLLVPKGTVFDDLDITDTMREDGYLDRSYSFGGVLVGTALAEVVEEQDDTVLKDGQKHMQEAEEYSRPITPVPYYIIGAAGLLLIILLIIRLVKVIRS